MGDLKTSCLYYNEAINLYTDLGVDADTLRHSRRVAQLYCDCLSDDIIFKMVSNGNKKVKQGVYLLGALLHDIGKACIPLDCLNKKGRLTSDEFGIIKCHAELGKFVAPIISSNFELNMQEYAIICKMVQLHHENYDGTGYPYGLKDERIPDYVKLLSILDVYDALTSKRSYKSAMSNQEAMSIINEDKGTKFDVFVLDTLLERLSIRKQTALIEKV